MAVDFSNLEDGLTSTLGDELNSRFTALKTAANASLKYQGAWSSSTAYDEHALVTYGGSAWIALQSSTNQTPAENSYWTKAGDTVSNASTSVAGIVELATAGETTTGTDTARATTPAGVKAAIDAAVAALIGGAPGALDTLNELAAALGDDDAFVTTITNSLAGKADKASSNTFTAPQTFNTVIAIGPVEPATLTSNQNDFSAGSRSAIRLIADAARSITGLVPIGSVNGELRLIINAGAYPITLKHEDTGSSANNRFKIAGAADLELGENDAALTYYDTVNSRHRAWPLGAALTGGGGGTWGSITGTLSDQTDLQTALDAKADESSLGGAALLDVGTTVGTVAAGDDSRLSDARTPTAHKTSHQSGGGDAIKLDDLAAPDDNTDLNVSTSAHGLAPKLPNDATKYLDGTGAWSVPAGGGGTSFDERDAWIFG